MTSEIEFARNGEIRIAYSVVGDGPVDLLHLFTFNNLDLIWENPLYARFLESIGSYTRLILVDRRGQGISDRLSPGDIPLLEDNVDDMVAVLDAAGSQRAVLMGGSDLGGLCAVLAASYPERVAGLILFAATARGEKSPDYPWQWSHKEWSDYLAEVSESWGTRRFAEANLPFFCPSLVGDRQQLDWFERFVRGTASANVELAIESVFRQMDIRSLLPTIHVPTLIMHRVDDRIEDIGGSRYMAETIPGARLVELEGGDHFPWAGDQKPVLREIERFVRGLDDHDAAADRILATVMFTDIVDSTAHAASLGDRRWRETREAHDRIVRDQISRFRGREVKTMGDGFLVTFDGPARGVLCAREICASTQALGIELRAGLHTGEIELDGNDDVSGIAVAIGARVGALAGPGEVFVSSTVKDLVVGSGLIFEDRGQHMLKGIPDEWRIYAAVGQA